MNQDWTYLNVGPYFIKGKYGGMICRKVKIIIEIIACTLEDALNIERYGGDRIELVSALSEGGLTSGGKGNIADNLTL